VQGQRIGTAKKGAIISEPTKIHGIMGSIGFWIKIGKDLTNRSRSFLFHEKKQRDSKRFSTRAFPRMMGADAIQSIIEKTRQVSISIDKERAAISKLVCTRNK
jgi:hypothetical protein